MKFLFHFYDLEQRAGIQRAICELSNALIADHNEVVLVSGTQRDRVAFPVDSRVVFEHIHNPEPFGTGPQVWPLKVLWAISQIRVLRQFARRHKPSIIVDHGTALGLVYPWSRLAGIPFILQRHFPVLRFPRGKVLYRLLSLLTAQRLIVVLTPVIAEEMRSLGYRNVWIIPNLVPEGARFSPYEEAAPRTGLLMGRAGNPQKGFDLFLEALALSGIEGWQFQIVGPGVDTDPLLRSLLEKHDLKGQVKLGPASSDPYRLIRDSSCLIMPSRYEALPMVALEALAMGRPVLGSDVDGLRDIIIPEVNGVLFRCEDIAHLSASLIDICKRPEDLARMADRCPSTVGRFQANYVVQSWVALARQVAHFAQVRAAKPNEG